MNFAVFVVLTVVAVCAFPSASPKKLDLGNRSGDRYDQKHKLLMCAERMGQVVSF